MPTYTFTCPNGHQFDCRVSRDTHQVTSDAYCGCVATATRASVYRINFGGFARTPSEERDWSHDFKNFREANAELDYKKERLEDATQTRIVEPPLAKMGERRAKQLMAKGVKDANDLL